MSRLNIFTGFLRWIKSLVGLLPPLRHWRNTCKRMCKAFCRWIHKRDRRRRKGCWVDVPPSEYRRPDPLLYSQFFLMKMGLAVTWDNPDIQLYDGAVPVGSSSLERDHDYTVAVRVWNNSYHAPAANLPVYLSFLSFGVGTTSTPIGTAYVDLGVKGSAHCPALAQFTWHTPQEDGHYCLQAQLVWADDANPDNNLGQENTDVGQAHSPAVFKFTVRNDAGITRRFELEPDVYQLPKREPCGRSRQEIVKVAEPPSRLAESRIRWSQARETQGYGQFPVAAGWEVRIEPRQFTLNPGEKLLVRVEIEHAGGSFRGRQPFNIDTFASSADLPRQLVGGVTLVVEGV